MACCFFFPFKRKEEMEANLEWFDTRLDNMWSQRCYMRVDGFYGFYDADSYIFLSWLNIVISSFFKNINQQRPSPFSQESTLDVFILERKSVWIRLKEKYKTSVIMVEYFQFLLLWPICALFPSRSDPAIINKILCCTCRTYEIQSRCLLL